MPDPVNSSNPALEYGRWNGALIDYATKSVPQGSPVFLSVDEDALWIIRQQFLGREGGTTQQAIDEFAAALRHRCLAPQGQPLDLAGLRGTDAAGRPRGVGFLAASARADGSWPIDTNLTTWVTTLAMRALEGVGRISPPQGTVEAADSPTLLEWLLRQQHKIEHPFTHARPGGWGWSDLSGAVPDADDTSGALVALRALAPELPTPNTQGPNSPHWELGLGAWELRQSATAGLEWLLEIQNADGGIPTFCRGWGALPFDRSAPDLTAHALEAWNVWRDAVVSGVRQRLDGAAARAVAYLTRVQRPDGSWAPLWFGNEHVAGELNLTYGTARVVTGLATPLARNASPAANVSGRRGVAWLLDTQRLDGGWGGGPGAPASIEETGLALAALAAAPEPRGVIDALRRGAAWLVAATSEGTRTPPAPIGLYFARLWYYEELYPVVMGLTGLATARSRMALTL